MNSFGFRYVRQDGLYRAEYRLAHWAGHRVVRGDDGEPILYAHASDAGLRAATELVKALNGNSTFWSGKTGNEARAAAELLFKARDHGEKETAGGADVSAA